MPKSIFARKRDLAYLFFFCIHIPIMFTVDLTSLYPPFVHDAFPIFKQIHAFQVETNADKFFSSDAPSWFRVFVLLEAVYHVPFSVWAIGALLGDNPNVPLQLLIFAAEAGFTTLPCVTEVLTWPEPTPQQRMSLVGMYGAYLALSVFMGIDMYGRLSTIIARASAAGHKKSQ